MKHTIDADLLEDFYEALSAAIESGINVPGSHAVTDMFRDAVARAEAAEVERDALLNISMTEPEPGAGCWRCGREIKPGEMSPDGRVHNNPLICVFVYMRRLIVAEGEITALRAQVGDWNSFNTKPEHAQDIEILTRKKAIYYADDDIYRLDDKSTWEGWRPAPPQEAAKEA